MSDNNTNTAQAQAQAQLRQMIAAMMAGQQQPTAIDPSLEARFGAAVPDEQMAAVAAMLMSQQ